MRRAYALAAPGFARAARSLGASLTDEFTATAQVRNYCRTHEIDRLAEAYVIEGFKAARMMLGLSERV